MRIAAALGCVLALTIASAGQAQQPDADNIERSVFTFGFPVQVPGKRLPPGTYVFQVGEERGARQVIRIYDGTGKDLIATVFAERGPDLPQDTPVHVSAAVSAATPGSVLGFRAADGTGFRLVYEGAAAGGPAAAGPPQPAGAPVAELQRILEEVRQRNVRVDRDLTTSGPATDQFMISREDLEAALRYVQQLAGAPAQARSLD